MDSGPTYLSELLKSYQPTRSLRSCDQHLLSIPKFRLITFGGRSFSAQAPVLWNALPLEIRILKSLPVFKSQLKTFYFRIAFNDLV
jgi:hypothetical protein